MMSAFLPQFDPEQQTRQQSLRDARSKYQFNYTHVSPLAMVEHVPIDQEFSMSWMVAVAETVGTAFRNRLELADAEPTLRQRFEESLLGLLQFTSLAVDTLKSNLDGFVENFIRHEFTKSSWDDPAKQLEDFAKLFSVIGLPPVSAQLGNDIHFAAMRLGGPNPVMLQRIAKLDDRFPFSEADYKAVVPGDSLAAAGAEGRLFFADYSVLQHIEEGSTHVFQLPKYLYAPMALFVVDRKTKEFRPVAIQCRQCPGPDNPIFTPDDDHNWLIAKTIVEIADGNVHESITHLGRTHLLIEPFVVTTFRQLAPNHPIYLLLMPHFEGTLRINELAWRYLIQDDGPVDRMLGAKIEDTRGLAVTGLRAKTVFESALPQSLRARGVDDSTWLASYPYRDDALLYWDAVATWVLDYLKIYYPSDQEVGADTELLAWIKELGAEDGGRLPGFDAAPSPTIASIAEILTFVIFTASVQHAAVNFPQYSLMSYVPNMPLAGYHPAPRSKKGATQDDYLKHLPPLSLSELQMDVGYILGSVHYTTLGEYRADQFKDPRVKEPLGKFQRNLSSIGLEIVKRNTHRTPYEFLKRSGIPQSINI